MCPQKNEISCSQRQKLWCCSWASGEFAWTHNSCKLYLTGLSWLPFLSFAVSLSCCSYFGGSLRTSRRLQLLLRPWPIKGIGVGRWIAECDRVLDHLQTVLTTAAILIPPNWRKPFHFHVDTFQHAVGGTLTQIDENGVDCFVAYILQLLYFSEKFSEVEQNYTENDRELTGLVYFLKRFRCHLEGCIFEFFTDNQALKHFFTKPSLNRRKARL